MEKQKPWWQDSIYFFGIVSGWVAIPVIIALFVGKYLDTKYGTAPWLFLSAIGLAFLISIAGIVKETKQYIKRMEQEAKKDEPNH